jgi:hypothetical protein
MPGFLAAYEGTERIPLAGGYWVDVKKCLSSAEYAPVELALGSRQHVSASAKGGGVQFTDIDTREAQIRMLVASITDWNLDDDHDDPEGTKWALAPDKVKRANIERLPAKIRMQVYKRCDELNGPPEEAEQAAFPGEAERGDPDGDPGPGGAAGLPDREGVLAAARPDEGDAQDAAFA